MGDSYYDAPAPEAWKESLDRAKMAGPAEPLARDLCSKCHGLDSDECEFCDPDDDEEL